MLEGKVVSVTCLAISEDKPIHFQWDKNGQILGSTKNNITIENSDKFSVLILNNVSIENDGNYTCTAKNRYGSSKHSAYLNVKGKMAFYCISVLLISVYRLCSYKNLIILFLLTFISALF